MNYTIKANGKTFQRIAWTGGDTPTKESFRNSEFRSLVRAYFDDQIRDCGGLDLWACAGTSALERARIFWNRAKLDAHRTLNP